LKNAEKRGRRIFYLVLRLSLIWTILLVSSTSSSLQTTDSESESAEQGEKVYRLPPPGEDSRIFYLTQGEKMFRTRDFREARAAFGKVLQLDSRDAQAHYFIGLIEYEEGNVEKAKFRFQLAHECLSSLVDTLKLPIDVKQVQLEFPGDYETRVYYKDGWYMTPKDPLAAYKDYHSLDADSTYKIQLKARNRESWVRSSTIIGFLVVLSFFLGR